MGQTQTRVNTARFEEQCRSVLETARQLWDDQYKNVLKDIMSSDEPLDMLRRRVAQTQRESGS